MIAVAKTCLAVLEIPLELGLSYLLGFARAEKGVVTIPEPSYAISEILCGILGG
jgi:hypothetical protein